MRGRTFTRMLATYAICLGALIAVALGSYAVMYNIYEDMCLRGNSEAMANGLPVISTDRCIAGLELVEKGKNGYIVPAENTRLLAQAMKRILSSPRRMEAMGRNSLERVKGHTMEEIGKGHIRDIDQYLAGRNEKKRRWRGNQQR